MTSTTDQAATSTGWRAEGEANHYTIMRRRPANEVSPEKVDWLATVRVNGELTTLQQEALVEKMAAAISATSAAKISGHGHRLQPLEITMHGPKERIDRLARQVLEDLSKVALERCVEQLIRDHLAPEMRAWATRPSGANELKPFAPSHRPTKPHRRSNRAR